MGGRVRVALLVAGVLALAAAVVWRATPRPRPHVIIYLVDTLRADHLGCYGYGRDTSPTLDAFAREGVRFERALAPSSWTKPSVASLFSGLYPPQHGAERRSQKLREDVPVLAEVMKAHGYATIGVVSNPNVLPVFGFARGFDAYVDVESIARTARADDVHRALLEALPREPDRPQFLYVHTRDPHAPYEPPEPYDQRFGGELDSNATHIQRKMALYDGEIAYGDNELGELFARLRDRGLYDDALIVVVSDHGEEFLDHGGTKHGHTLYQEQLHVPLVVRFPGGRNAGRVVAEPVRLMDLMPTLLEWLEIEPAGSAHSFAPLVTGDAADYQPPLYARLDVDTHAVDAIVEGNLKLIERSLPEARTELYDLDADPGELQDLSETSAPLAAELRGSLDRVVARMREGTYLELVNSAGGGGHHRVNAVVTVTGGELRDLTVVGLEASDTASLSPDRKRLELDLTLLNRRNPIHQRPLWFVDRDRIRFEVSGSAAELTVAIRVDGQPLERMWLGDESAARDPSWRVSPLRAPVSVGPSAVERLEPGPAPSARLHSIVRTPVSEAEIDEALDARLKALGYVE